MHYPVVYKVCVHNIDYYCRRKRSNLQTKYQVFIASEQKAHILQGNYFSVICFDYKK